MEHRIFHTLLIVGSLANDNNKVEIKSQLQIHREKVIANVFKELVDSYEGFKIIYEGNNKM